MRGRKTTTSRPLKMERTTWPPCGTVKSGRASPKAKVASSPGIKTKGGDHYAQEYQNHVYVEMGVCTGFC